MQEEDETREKRLDLRTARIPKFLVQRYREDDRFFRLVEDIARAQKSSGLGGADLSAAVIVAVEITRR